MPRELAVENLIYESTFGDAVTLITTELQTSLFTYEHMHHLTCWVTFHHTSAHLARVESRKCGRINPQNSVFHIIVHLNCAAHSRLEMRTTVSSSSALSTGSKSNFTLKSNHKSWRPAWICRWSSVAIYSLDIAWPSKTNAKLTVIRALLLKEAWGLSQKRDVRLWVRYATQPT